ncbi:MAG: alanine racemase [Halioglobus sp.]|nr:alanine racemase [Halioglobus sp.]
MSNPDPTAAIPRHERMDQFPVVDNCLQVGGRPLPDIAASIGTPFYAYDGDIMAAQVGRLRAVLPPAVRLHYAIKANPMPPVARHLAGLTDGLDVASAGELRIALATGTHPRNISFAGPGKSVEDLTLAVDSGVIINMESEQEMSRIADLASQAAAPPRVSIRVNPDFELKTAGMKMSSGAKPFGVDAERVPQMLATLRELPLEFVGFHIFSGSQSLRADAIAAAHTQTFELALRLAEHAPGPVRWLNIGGGLGVPYFPGEQRLDLQPIAENLSPLVAQATREASGCRNRHGIGPVSRRRGRPLRV